MDEEPTEEPKATIEYLNAINGLLEKCNDLAMLDLVLKLLQKSCCYIE